jgi:integrase
VTGRYRYVSRSVVGTKKAAEAALAALLTEVNSGAGGHKGADATIGQLVEQWLDLRRESLSVTTWEAYCGKARHRLIPALGEIPVRKLTVRDIDAFYRSLRRNHDLAASTVRQINNILSGSLDQAVRWGWRTDNPARIATLPPQRQGEVRPPTPSEVLDAIEAADDEFATFLRVAAAVGSRRGEVSALRWSAVDLDRGEVKIVRAIVEDADGVLHEKDTKTHQARRVALDAGTVDALRHWHDVLADRASACGVKLPANGYVFSPDPDGARPWRPYRWTSYWRRVREKAGICGTLRRRTCWTLVSR